MGGVALLHQDREVETGRAAADADDPHRVSVLDGKLRSYLHYPARGKEAMDGPSDARPQSLQAWGLLGQRRWRPDLTRVPERWPARWDEVVEVAQMADRAGIEFFLPIARWKGFGGEMNSREWSFETLTYAAALAGVTEHIALFSTVHVPMVHPVFAAKALATVDHASGGRAGLNIVCGWSPQEFELFGLTMIEDRYAQGLEWAEIMERIYAGGAAVRLRRQVL